jgi:hypothetical protein
VLPTGSNSLSPNSLSTIVVPSTITRAAVSTSFSLMNAPSRIASVRKSRKLGETPLTATCTVADGALISVGTTVSVATARMLGAIARLLRAAASSVVIGSMRVRVVLAGADENTNSTFDPNDWNSDAIKRSTPRPRLTSPITAPTPMMIPSVVSTARSRLLTRLDSAMRTVSSTFN